MKMVSIFFLMALLFCGSVLGATCGGAVQCDCGDTLIESHTMWYDLSCNDGLTIGGDEITLDCGGHLIDGNATGNYGIGASDASNVTIRNCELTGWNSYAVSFSNVMNGVIENVDVSSSAWGISLSFSSQNRIADNILAGNNRGMRIGCGTTENTVTGNRITDSADTGVNFNWGTYCASSSGNHFYDNYFYNANNINLGNLTSTWNTTQTPGTNIEGGPFIGGNYWGDQNGTGFSDTCADTDANGFCNDIYVIGDANIDYLPLALFESEPPIHDADGDGVNDNNDNCPLNSNPDQADYDGDNVGDVCDADTDGDSVPNEEDICPGGDDNVDSDGDLVPDYCDPCPLDFDNDADGDGVCGNVDVCVGGDDSQDFDNDGTPDFCDVCPNDPENDADGDGICEFDDNCEVIWNPSQIDTDGDSYGDACDPDNDNDGILNDDDNCSFDVNPSQEDFDNDGVGDVCDTDFDDDGVIDSDDQCLGTMLGDAVNTFGCSIAELCPCAHPEGGSKWKNHGAYVSCVAHASEDFVAAEIISEAEKEVIVSAAGQSACGYKE